MQNQSPVHNIIGKPKRDIHFHLAQARSDSGIIVEGISKWFGNFQALNEIDLVVPPGKVTALLGPNGAGKTTLVRILTTLLRPDSGRAFVAGFDVVRNPDALRSAIGLAGQNAAIDDNLTGRENIEMVGMLYHLGTKRSKAKAEELLIRFDLVDAADRVAKTYSGGMRRRLDLAASLVGNPKILFLDEPTTGLDPRSRMELWKIINELVEEGTTVLLTTQYLEEADQLADSIAVIDHGKLIALGTSNELKSQVGGDVLEIHVSDESMITPAVDALARIGSEEPQVDRFSNKISIPVSGGTTVMAEAIRRLDSARVSIADIVLRRPTLDDVFLALTGHGAQ